MSQITATRVGREARDPVRRVVCELDPSARSEERVLDALAVCEEHGATLHVVWVDPCAGAFGLPAVLTTALELAGRHGVDASSAVRFGDREIPLRTSARKERS